MPHIFLVVFLVVGEAEGKLRRRTPQEPAHRLSVYFFSDVFGPVSDFALLSFLVAESLLESPFPSEDSDLAEPPAGFFA